MIRSSFHIALLVLAAGGLCGCKGEKPAASTTAPAPPTASTGTDAPAAPSPAPAAATPPAHEFAGSDAYTAVALNRIEMPNGLVIEDLKVGEGEAALPRAVLTFHFRGKIENGAEFESTAEKAEGPAPFTEALNRLNPGLASGLVGIKAGGRRRLTMPQNLAPRAPVTEGVPADAKFIYVIDAVAIRQQLVPVTSPPPPPAGPAPAVTPPTEKPAAESP